jgi:hypothetical protein
VLLLKRIAGNVSVLGELVRPTFTTNKTPVRLRRHRGSC